MYNLNVMSDQTDKLQKELTELGLSEEEAQLYLYTNKNGPSTALKSSKDLHIGRTKVYRMLDKLISLGLIAQNLQDRGFVFEATPLSNLNVLLTKKELELNKLRISIPNVINQLTSITKETTDTPKVRYYKGLEGLQQATWNSLQANKYIRIYEKEATMDAFTAKDFSEEMRKELVKRRIHTKQLTNLTKIPNYTKVTTLITKYWEVRYLNPKQLKINIETVIYNDTVALYDFDRKEPYCVEIQDKSLASMQKQLFEFVWKSAERMTITSKYGKAIYDKRKPN